jgi:deazaflavin-dependent oxidoreductase (nitroreductase family)
MAAPDIEVSIHGQRRQFRARRAEADEKAALWPRVVAAYSSYAGYEHRSSRDIPLVILEPR